MRHITRFSSSVLITSAQVACVALGVSCAPQSPAVEPRTEVPEQPAPAPDAPVAEAVAPLPMFTASQQEQLDLLGPLCTTAYHLDANGQVDQVGCTGNEPSATPSRADTLRPYGQSWRGHFRTATSDDLLVWFTSADFMLATTHEGKTTSVSTRAVVSDAQCVKWSGPDAQDVLACSGSYPGLAHSVPDLLKVLRFEDRQHKNGLLAVTPLPIFSAHSAENVWYGLCDNLLAVSYSILGLTAEKNSETGANDLKFEIERQGWLSTEMPAAKKKNASTCKEVERANNELTEPPVLPEVPSKTFAVVLPFDLTETPALTKIQDEAENEMALSDERGRKMGIAR